MKKYFSCLLCCAIFSVAVSSSSFAEIGRSITINASVISTRDNTDCKERAEAFCSYENYTGDEYKLCVFIYEYKCKHP